MSDSLMSVIRAADALGYLTGTELATKYKVSPQWLLLIIAKYLPMQGVVVNKAIYHIPLEDGTYSVVVRYDPAPIQEYFRVRGLRATTVEGSNA